MSENIVEINNIEATNEDNVNILSLNESNDQKETEAKLKALVDDKAIHDIGQLPKMTVGTRIHYVYLTHLMYRHKEFLKSSLANKEKTIKTKENEIKELVKKVDIISAALADKEKLLIDLDNQTNCTIDNLKSANNKLNDDIKSCESQFSKQKQEIDELNSRLEVLDEKNYSLKEEISLLNTTVETKQLEIDNLKEKIQRQKIDFDKIVEEYTDDEPNKDEKKSDNSKQITKLQKEVNELIKTIKFLENEKKSLQEKVYKYENDLKLKNRNLDAVLELNSQLKTKVKHFEERYYKFLPNDTFTDDYSYSIDNNIASTTNIENCRTLKEELDSKINLNISTLKISSPNKNKSENISTIGVNKSSNANQPKSDETKETKKVTINENIVKIDRSCNTSQTESNEDTSDDSEYSSEDETQSSYSTSTGRDSSVESVKQRKKVSRKKHRPHISLKINSSIEDFSGKPNERVDLWLESTRRILLTAGYDNSHQMVETASTFLKGIALQTLQYAEREYKNMDWSRFEKIMKKRFLPIDFQTKLRNELSTLNQTRSFSEYLNKFQMIINQIEKMDEADKIFYFINGLNTSTKQFVKIKVPKSLNSAIKYAQAHADTYNNESIQNAMTADQPNKNKKEKTYKKKKYNPNKYKSSNENNKEQCKYCKKPGHNISECYKRKKKNSQADNKENKDQNKPNNNQNNKPSNHNKQMKAKKPAAKAYNIAIDSKSDNSINLMKWYAKINNHETMAVFDTGATISVISKKLANELKLNIFKTDKLINTADGSTNKAVGITECVKIEVEDTVAYIELIVTNIHHIDLLLGLNWFKQTKVIIDPAENKLIFPKHEIDLSEAFHIEHVLNDYCLSIIIDDEEEVHDEQLKIQTFDLSDTVANHHLAEIEKLIKEFDCLFITDLMDIGLIEFEKYTIETTDDEAVYSLAFRVPPSVEKEMRQIVDDLLI